MAITDSSSRTKPCLTDQPENTKWAWSHYLCEGVHDVSDEDAIRILQPIAKATGSKSKLLITDLLVPGGQGEADRATAVIDMTMFAYAGKQRTEDGFIMIIEAAGLEQVKKYKPSIGATALFFKVNLKG